MKKERFAIISGVLAVLAPFICCIGPVLALIFGAGAATSAAIFTERYSWLFFGLAAAALSWSGWQYWKRYQRKNGALILESVITCPKCGFKQKETMPENACTYFYECRRCKAVLKPILGDCCVFCSYGTVKCPPMQTGESCCS